MMHGCRAMMHRCRAMIAALGVVVAVVASGCAPPIETGFLDRHIADGDRVHPYQVFVPASYQPNGTPLPVILSLHGADERGDDGRQTRAGLGAAVRRYPERYPAIIVFPQSPRDSLLWTEQDARVALAALEAAQQEFDTDPARTTVTGWSRGGAAAWYLAYRYPGRFAAVLAICGFVDLGGDVPAPVVPPEDGEPFLALATRLAHLAAWIVHGSADVVVPVEQSRRLFAVLQSAGAPVQYMEVPGAGHEIWDAAYGSDQIARWLVAQRQSDH